MSIAEVFMFSMSSMWTEISCLERDQNATRGGWWTGGHNVTVPLPRLNDDDGCVAPRRGADDNNHRRISRRFISHLSLATLQQHRHAAPTEMSANQTVRNALIDMGVEPARAHEAALRYQTVEPAVNWVFGDGETVSGGGKCTRWTFGLVVTHADNTTVETTVARGQRAALLRVGVFVRHRWVPSAE